MNAELDAALGFLARIDRAVAGELVPLDWGTGVFDRERPLVWDANYVRAERTAELEAAYLAEAAEPLFVERGRCEQDGGRRGRAPRASGSPRASRPWAGSPFTES